MYFLPAGDRTEHRRCNDFHHGIHKGLALIKHVACAGAFLALSGMACAQTDMLESVRSRDGNELGLTLSHYDYREPSVDVRMTALNVGIEYQRTHALSSDRFWTAGVDYAYGPDSYSGSGNLIVPKYYYNLKLAVGKDLFYDTYVLSPYVGLGYRFLSQAGGGLATSSGAYFYDRQSSYLYLPLGVKRRIAVSGGAQFETTFEYDHLLMGNQYSGLSVADNWGYSDSSNVNNRQTTGYGLNASVMYRRPDGWSFGPYWKYWNISASDSATWTYKKSGTAYSVSAWEPANTTDEFGFKAMYKF